jgi:hypothetical protein
VARVYVNEFLKGHSKDVRGRVLEFGNNRYTIIAGGNRITQSYILCPVSGNPAATIVADLTKADLSLIKTYGYIILEAIS